MREGSHPGREKVAQGFSKQIHHYHLASKFHAQLAEQLSELIAQHSHSPKKILEIGSHNGLQTNKLKEKLNLREATWVSCDIHTSAKAYTPNNIEFIVADGEALPFANHTFDLIYSGATFQWFTDLPETLNKLLELLKPNGILAFSIFTQPSLEPFKSLFGYLDLETRFLNLYNHDSLQTSIATFNVLEYENLQNTIYFDTFRDIRLFIKHMGANASNSASKAISRKQYRDIVSSYESYRKSEGLPLQMAGSLVLLKKPS